MRHPTGTFCSLHSFIFLMWLEKSLTTFYDLQWKTLTIPRRVGGTEKRKGGTIEAIAELPPQGVKSESKWRDGLCWVGINVGRRLQSHAHDGISHSEKCHWHHFFFPPSYMRNIWRTFQAFVCFFYTSFGGESPRPCWLGMALKLRPKFEASQGGLISVLVNVYMWIIYLSSSRKWGTITSLGKKSRKTNRWYLIPSFVSCFFFTLSPFFSLRQSVVSCWGQIAKDSDGITSF